MISLCNNQIYIPVKIFNITFYFLYGEQNRNKTIRNKSTQKFDLEYIYWTLDTKHICYKELQVDLKVRKIYYNNYSIKS